jgi:hypothetical protein
MDHITISEEVRAGITCLREIRNASPELRDRFSDFLQSNAELFRVKDDRVLAIGTSDVVISLEPTKRLSELVAAVRAWKDEDGIRKEP